MYSVYSPDYLLFCRGGIKGMRKKVKRTISNRSTRRPFTPIR